MLGGDIKHQSNQSYGALAADSPLLSLRTPKSDEKDSKATELVPSIVAAPASTAIAVPGEKIGQKIHTNVSPPHLKVVGAALEQPNFSNYWIVLIALCFNTSTRNLTINVPIAADLTRALPFVLILNQSIYELSIIISLNPQKVAEEVQELQSITCKRNKEIKSVAKEPAYTVANKARAAAFILEFAWHHMELAVYDDYDRHNNAQRLIVTKLLQDLNATKKAIKLDVAAGNKEILTLIGQLRDRLNTFIQQHPTEEYLKLIANLDQTIRAEFNPIANGNKAALHWERAKDVGQGVGCCIFWVVQKAVTLGECVNGCLCRGCVGLQDQAQPFVSDWCDDAGTPPKDSVYPLCCGVVPCCCCSPGRHRDMAIASFKEHGEILAAMNGPVSAAAPPPQQKMG